MTMQIQTIETPAMMPLIFMGDDIKDNPVPKPKKKTAKKAAKKAAYKKAPAKKKK